MSQIASSSRSLSSLEQVLLGLLFLAAIAILSLPPARSVSAAFGWMPLWLLGLPAASLTALLLSRATRKAVAAGSGATARGRRRLLPPPATGSRRGGAARRLRRPRAA